MSEDDFIFTQNIIKLELELRALAPRLPERIVFSEQQAKSGDLPDSMRELHSHAAQRMKIILFCATELNGLQPELQSRLNKFERQ